MDDFLRKNTNEENKLCLVDKKIEFRYIKEKRTSRTYIFNLDHYIKDDEKVKLLLISLKKTLGTACIKKENEFGVGYGFNGDFTARITQYLIDNKIVTKDAFK